MHVSGKRLHARSESPSVFWRGEIQSTAALPLLCFCSIYSLFCFLFCVFFGSPDRNSVMRNTNPQQTIIILGRKHTSVEVRNFFFPSGQIDNRWIINPVWEWALTSHSGYRCWTKFFFFHSYFQSHPSDSLPSLSRYVHLWLCPEAFSAVTTVEMLLIAISGSCGSTCMHVLLNMKRMHLLLTVLFLQHLFAFCRIPALQD